jgi:hypothetical protein
MRRTRALLLQPELGTGFEQSLSMSLPPDGKGGGQGRCMSVTIRLQERVMACAAGLLKWVAHLTAMQTKLCHMESYPADRMRQTGDDCVAVTRGLHRFVPSWYLHTCNGMFTGEVSSSGNACLTGIWQDYRQQVLGSTCSLCHSYHLL